MTRVERERQFSQFKKNCRDFCMMIPTIWKKCFAPLANGVENFEGSPEYQAALAEYRQFEAKEDVDYSGVLTYARELADRYDKTDRALDDKADSIIKDLG